MADKLEVGDRVRLIKHGTYPNMVGREFAISEICPPSTMFRITRNCVMLVNKWMWLRADVEDVELIREPGL